MFMNKDHVDKKRIVNIVNGIDKIRMSCCFIFTFVFGFIAHGFAFANYQPSHDSLAEAFATGSYEEWKIQLGRFLHPVYDAVAGAFISSPWVSGIVGLFFIALTAYLVTEMLQINARWAVALVCGILSTNLTVISLVATYAQDLGPDMLALFLAALGVYLWNEMRKELSADKRNRRICYTLAIAACLWTSMGLYQAYVCVYVSLVLILSIGDLLVSKETWKKIFWQDIHAAVSVVVAGIAYYISLKVICAVSGIALYTDGFNAVTNIVDNKEPIVYRLFNTFKQFVGLFLGTRGYMYPNIFPRLINALLVLILAIFLLVIARDFLQKGRMPGQTILRENVIAAAILTCMLPFSMNAMRLLNTDAHKLMVYAVWIFYVFILYITCNFQIIRGGTWKRNTIECSKGCQGAVFYSKVKLLVVFLLCIVIFYNVQTANAVYVRKNTEQEATLSVMTRVLDRIVATDGYEAGVTPVVFIGVPGDYLQDHEYLGRLDGTITGIFSNSAINGEGLYEKYFSLIMRVNVNVELESELKESAEAVSMPVFPEEGSVRVIDGTVVVKFSDEEQ